MRTQIYWLDGPWPGKLAIIPRPRGGDWLEDEVKSWQAGNIDVVLSALTDEELDSLDLVQEAKLAQALGIEHISFPIPDRGLPSSIRAVEVVARQLDQELARGKNVAIHCRQGIGR